MAAKFQKGKVAIYVQTLPHRKNPALIVQGEDGLIDVVANFKDEYMAKLFVKALRKVVKDGRPDKQKSGD